MAVTILGTPTGSQYAYVTANTARTLSVTVASGSNRVMVIIASGYHDPVAAPDAPVFDGVTATQVIHVNGGSLNFDTVTIWRIIAPTVTTANISWTQPAESIYLLSAAVVQDADQTTPVGDTDSATGAGTTATLTLTSAIDQLILGAACRGGTAPTAGADQTTIATGASGGEGSRSSYETGAASVTHSYTWAGSTDYAIAAIAVMPVASAAASAVPSRGARLPYAILAQ